MEISHLKHMKPDGKNVKKASEQHKQLANFIKGIHGQLRNDYEIFGAEEAWKNHVSQNEKLKVTRLYFLLFNYN